MDEAVSLPLGPQAGEICNIVTGCSLPCSVLWPIRRRSIAALTVTPAPRVRRRRGEHLALSGGHQVQARGELPGVPRISSPISFAT